MSEPILVLIRIKGQESYFDGDSFPYYEVGWKKGNNFYKANHSQCKDDEVEEWEEI